MRLLFVEDDDRIKEDVTILLKKQSYAVDTASSIADARRLLSDYIYDGVILDWTLPDGEGISLIPIIRTDQPKTPVIMLTARGQSEDIVMGLDAGADDYLPKPFEFTVLAARLRSLSRRSENIPMESIIRVGPLTIDPNTHTVHRGSKDIMLSPKEYALLEFLAKNNGHAIGRLIILERVWDEQADEMTNTVDVHVRYLRKKLDDGYPEKLIKTVKNIGYMLSYP